MYSVRGVGVSGAGAGSVAFGLWNPHSTQIIKLKRIVLSVQAGASSGTIAIFQRSSTRGTPASTVTPDISTDGKRGAGPPSGALLDLGAFTVQPTLDTDELFSFVQLGGTSGGDADFTQYDFQGEGFYIPPATGLCLARSFNNPTYEVTLTWSEDG
jgi:hypothetical protein